MTQRPSFPSVVQDLLNDEDVEAGDSKLSNRVVRLIPLQAQYVVHRQFLGTFTPMVFDADLEVSFDLSLMGGRTLEDKELSIDAEITKLRYLIEPFTNGTLFVDIDSPFMVHLLKGQEAGYYRQDIKEELFRRVKNDSELWFSHHESPYRTLQNQRVVCYDVENPKHGSMLDPRQVGVFIKNLSESKLQLVVQTMLIWSGQLSKVS